MVHQPPPLPLQAHGLLCWCLFLSYLSSTLFPFFSSLPSHFLAFHPHVLFLFFLHIPPPFLSSLSWLCPVSLLWPPGDLCPVTFLHHWPPVLCDCPRQMLPITVRNMPSISPLILKRLKVQFSLPPTCPLLSARPVDANRRHPSPNPPPPSCCH